MSSSPHNRASDVALRVAHLRDITIHIFRRSLIILSQRHIPVEHIRHMTVEFAADDTILIVAVNRILGSSLHLIPIVLHSTFPDTLHLRFRIHHTLNSLSIIVRVRRFRHLLNSVNTRIVMLASLEVSIKIISDVLVHLSVILLQVDVASPQLIVQILLIIIPALFQQVGILLLLLVPSHLLQEVTNKEHSVSLQAMLGNHVEIEVSYLLIILLSVKSIQHTSHRLIQRLHHVALKHLSRIAHRTLHGVLQHIRILRRGNILNLLVRHNRIHQLLQRKHIVHIALGKHIAVLVQRTVVSVKCRAGRWGSAKVNITVRSLIPFSLGKILHVSILAVISIEHAIMRHNHRHTVMVETVFHRLGSHLPIRIILILLQVLAQPEQVLHIFSIRSNTITDFMKEIRYLILDTIPEARFTLAILGESGNTFLNGIVDIQRIVLSLLIHQLLQIRILWLIQVIPHITKELLKSVFTEKLSHALVSNHLMPDSLLGSISVVYIRHVKMHLASLLIIPASYLSAILNSSPSRLVGDFINR